MTNPFLCQICDCFVIVFQKFRYEIYYTLITEVVIKLLVLKLQLQLRGRFGNWKPEIW